MQQLWLTAGEKAKRKVAENFLPAGPIVAGKKFTHI
jgi:hypothetical protein